MELQKPSHLIHSVGEVAHAHNRQIVAGSRVLLISFPYGLMPSNHTGRRIVCFCLYVHVLDGVISQNDTHFLILYELN